MKESNIHQEMYTSNRKKSQCNLPAVPEQDAPEY